MIVKEEIYITILLYSSVLVCNVDDNDYGNRIRYDNVNGGETVTQRSC